jgi:tripeptidyl-peptidase I
MLISVSTVYRQCDEFMKLALQGTTTLIASGDYGVAGYAGDITESGCLSGYNLTEKIYNPDAVSACPYVRTDSLPSENTSWIEN